MSLKQVTQLMGKVRISSFSISADGYGAGPNQSLENPLGVGGTQLHNWAFPTQTFQQNLFGDGGGRTGVDDEFAARGFRDVGAWIMGRNMFGPVRGPWPDDAWKGWWGDTPPYHVPVFVLTHHARPPIEMDGGTSFHFVTGGIHDALCARATLRTATTSGSAAVFLSCGSIFKQISWTRRISRSLRCCSVPANISSAGST